LTFLDRSSGFLRRTRRIHAGVTSGIPFCAPRVSTVLDLPARAGLLLRLLAALPLHPAILKPDLHLQQKRRLLSSRLIEIQGGNGKVKTANDLSLNISPTCPARLTLTSKSINELDVSQRGIRTLHAEDRVKESSK